MGTEEKWKKETDERRRTLIQVSSLPRHGNFRHDVTEWPRFLRAGRGQFQYHH